MNIEENEKIKESRNSPMQDINIIASTISMDKIEKMVKAIMQEYISKNLNNKREQEGEKYDN